MLWWLLPLGALIGLALHLANTLPDIDGDAPHGVRGLAHRLGPRRSMSAGWSAFAVAMALSGRHRAVAGYDVRVRALTVGGACIAASIGLYAVRRDALSLRFGFGAIAVGSAVCGRLARSRCLSAPAVLPGALASTARAATIGYES